MTPDRLGTAQWADPMKVAGKYSYRSGSFWLGKTVPWAHPVGTDDDRHVCIVAGTRSGKGTSVLIPNLIAWPGSVVVVDPTGDAASITAARRDAERGDGEGIRQPVHVLDPYKIADVDDRLRASFNPLDLLDPDSRTVVRDAERIASSLVPDSEKDEPWAQNGARRLLAGLILHVLSHFQFEGRRNLVTVRELVHRGDVAARKYLLSKGKGSPPSAFDMLWSSMALNTRFNGEIAGTGEEFERMTSIAPAQWAGVHDVALSATKFINNDDMRDCLVSSSFSIDDLKTHPAGVSLFLTIPSRDKIEDFRWLRLMTTMILNQMETLRVGPASGHPVLFLLDEFAGLQRMDRIEAGIAEIAKYDVKLCLVLQNLGQLQNVYGDNWESFLANCGTKMFFGIDDQFTREYVSGLIGETEVIRQTGATTEGSSSASTITETDGSSTTVESSKSESRGDSYKRWMFNLRDTAGLFRRLFGNAHANDVTQTGSSEGTSSETSRSEGTSQSSERSSTRTEHLHKRPLVTPDEVGKLFQRVTDKSDGRYPGHAICLVSDYPDPLLLRRVNHFDEEPVAGEDNMEDNGAPEQTHAAAGEFPADVEFSDRVLFIPRPAQALSHMRGFGFLTASMGSRFRWVARGDALFTIRVCSKKRTLFRDPEYLSFPILSPVDGLVLTSNFWTDDDSRKSQAKRLYQYVTMLLPEGEKERVLGRRLYDPLYQYLLSHLQVWLEHDRAVLHDRRSRLWHQHEVDIDDMDQLRDFFTESIAAASPEGSVAPFSDKEFNGIRETIFSSHPSLGRKLDKFDR